MPAISKLKHQNNNYNYLHCFSSVQVALVAHNARLHIENKGLASDFCSDLSRQGTAIAYLSAQYLHLLLTGLYQECLGRHQVFQVFIYSHL